MSKAVCRSQYCDPFRHSQCHSKCSQCHSQYSTLKIMNGKTSLFSTMNDIMNDIVHDKGHNSTL